MKSELLVTEDSPEKTLPALYKSAPDGLVVLFTAKKEGLLISHPGESTSNCRFYINWIPYTETKHWQRLPSGSKVILTQD